MKLTFAMFATLVSVAALFKVNIILDNPLANVKDFVKVVDADSTNVIFGETMLTLDALTAIKVKLTSVSGKKLEKSTT